VTGRKSQAQICSACVRKKVFQLCPRGRVVRTCRIYFSMVRLQTRLPNLSNSPRIRSAPHSRLSLAISLIKATISAVIFDLRAAALDVYFQKSRNPWRCHRSNVVFLHDEEGLFPGSNHSCQKHQEDAVRFGTCRSFHVSAQDHELLAQKCVFCHEFGLASSKVCQRPQEKRGSVRFCPGDEAVVERLKTKVCQPFDEGKDLMHSVRYPFVKMRR